MFTRVFEARLKLFFDNKWSNFWPFIEAQIDMAMIYIFLTVGQFSVSIVLDSFNYIVSSIVVSCTTKFREE